MDRLVNQNSLILALVAALLCLFGPADLIAQETSNQAFSLDSKAKKKLANLALRFWKARPKNYFKNWDDNERKAIMDEAQGMGLIPAGKSAEVLKILWKPARKHGPSYDKKKGSRCIINTEYGEAWFLLNGGGKNKGLVLALHGGGEGAGSAESPGNWPIKNCIGMGPQGIRLVHDTWNTVHGERFLMSMIEIAKAKLQINPNRVYSAGFSMGGTGSWFMAGRHPDLLAGAMPCAGVLMAKPKSQLKRKEDIEDIQHGFVPNVRNLAMHYFIGLADVNCMPGTYLFVWDLIEELRKDDPKGYQKINFKTYPGLAHSMAPGEPSRGLNYLGQQTRDTFPETVVWEYALNLFPKRTAEDHVTRFRPKQLYWLGCSNPRDRQVLRATRSGNVFQIEYEGRRGLEGLSILINPSMIDVSQDVVVKHGKKVVYKGKPQPNLKVMLDSLDARVDTSMWFDRKIELKDQ